MKSNSLNSLIDAPRRPASRSAAPSESPGAIGDSTIEGLTFFA